MVYSENVFDLLPGPAEVSRELLSKIRPEHIALMKHLSLRASLPYLTLPLLDQLEDDYLNRPAPEVGQFSYIFNRRLRHHRSSLRHGHKYEIEA